MWAANYAHLGSCFVICSQHLIYVDSSCISADRTDVMQCRSVECCQAGTVDRVFHIQDVADDAGHNYEAESKP